MIMPSVGYSTGNSQIIPPVNLHFLENIDLAPTLNGDNHDMSGGGAYDVATKDPFQDITERAFTYEYEDTTNSPPVEDDEGKSCFQS